MAMKQRSLGWQLGLSAYWFATNLKWFILLSAVLPGQVEKLVPGGEKGSKWGAVMMIGAIWALFGPALFGHISDRLGRKVGRWRPFMAIGAACTVAALMVLSTAPTYLTIVFGYLFLQISDDMAQGSYSSLIPGLVPEQDRGRASGIMGLLMMFAQIAGGVGAFILKDNLQNIYLMIAGTIVVCALITILTVREDPAYDNDNQGTSFFTAWIEPWKNPDFCWVWFTRFLNALGFYLIYTYLKFFLGDVIGEFKIFGFTVADIKSGSPKEVAAAAGQAVFVMLLLISLIAAISSVVGGKMADRIGRKRVIYLSGGLMTLPLIPFVFAPNFTLIILLSIPFAIGYGAYQSADWALASDIMPNRSAMAKDMGLWQSSISAPQILSGLAGWVVDKGNHFSPGFGYKFTFLFAAIAYALGIVLIKKVRGST